jgi:hypothetical protein
VKNEKLLDRVPVWLVLDTHAGLLGSAVLAALEAGILESRTPTPTSVK